MDYGYKKVEANTAEQDKDIKGVQAQYAGADNTINTSEYKKNWQSGRGMNVKPFMAVTKEYGHEETMHVSDKGIDHGGR